MKNKRNNWIIDDDFKLSEESLSIEDMLKQRKRIKLLGFDDGVTDEEFNKIIGRMRNEYQASIIPKGKLVEQYRGGKDIKCPECGEKLKHTGERKCTKLIYCDKCDFEIIID